MLTDQTLLQQVDEFLARTGMAPTRFGIEALSDGGLVKGMREGRSLSLRNAEKLVNFMAARLPQCSACTRAAAGDVAAGTAVACPMRQVALEEAA